MNTLKTVQGEKRPLTHIIQKKQEEGKRPFTPLLPPLIQRASQSPGSITPAEAAYLQRTVGNQALGRMLRVQAKPTLGPVGDIYEQEADAVAKQVVQNINQPQPQAVQRQEEDDDELQMKPFTLNQPRLSFLQRQEGDEDVQMKPLFFVQRQEDEEELQMKPVSSVQRQEDEEELQMKPSSMMGGGEISSGVEDGIQRAKGGGRPLSTNTQSSMGQAFNADFSSVKIHTGSQSNQLNQSIQARAFTTGQDIFFRDGEYNPNSSSGQELLAHELTHTIQQSGGKVQRNPSTQIGNGNPSVVQRWWNPFKKKKKTSTETEQQQMGGSEDVSSEQMDVDEESTSNLHPEAASALSTAASINPHFNTVIDFLRREENKLLPEMQAKFIDFGIEPTEIDARERVAYAGAYFLSMYMEKHNWIDHRATPGQKDSFARSKVVEKLPMKSMLIKHGIANTGKLSPEAATILKDIDSKDVPVFNRLLERSEVASTDVNVGPRIEVRLSKIPGKKEGMNAHSFILYTDEEGKQSYIAAYGDGRSDEHEIITQEGEYKSGIHEFDNWSPSVGSRVLEQTPDKEASAVKSKWDAVKIAARAMEGIKASYNFLWQNCNTAASWILKQAGVDNYGAPPGGGIAPWGWGFKLKAGKSWLSKATNKIFGFFGGSSSSKSSKSSKK